MREIRSLFQLILRTISDLRQAAGFVYTFLSAFFSSRATLAARVLAAESQLASCKHRIVEENRPRPRFTRAFRLLWVLLSRIWDQWHQVAHLMQPATVKRWHTTAFRFTRPHQGLDGDTPFATKKPSVAGPLKLLSFPICGGLHHRYERVAA